MNYPSIRIEGAILSPDILDRLDDALGQRPVDFGFDSSTKVKDEIVRAWADAQDYWRIFQRKLETIKPDSPATTETRQQWIVPLLGLLGYQLEYQSRGVELNGKNYPISHRATNRGNTPLHIIGYREPSGLDRKPEKAALRMSAHAMVQEYLNLRDEVYGLVTNGRLLRLLRDSSRLVKLTYLEFDLDRIFMDGLFADFAVLYRLLHASRLPSSSEATAESLIERYHQDSLDSGARIREGLSRAVESAIRDFANGFLSHPANEVLRELVISGNLKPDQYYQQLLRLIYRLLFLMVIEERGLVFPANSDRRKREIYEHYYSLQRLRRLSEKRYLADRRKHDLWQALLSTFQLYEADGPGNKLGIDPLAGDLFDSEAIGKLGRCQLGNDILLGCLRSLGLYEHPDTRQLIRVNYAALNVEEFGSVYEGLLEYRPVFNAVGNTVEFAFAQGDERATTGSHYTPDDLVQPLIKHSLDYLIADKLKEKDPEKALLSLRVADISCGSGHILLAAARRIATELASVRTSEDQPAPAAFRTAVRDVVRECIYGVDLNPLAVELCKVALWLEAHNPGQPLNFLDHHVRCGNSIVGFVRREDVERGVPDEAFAPMPGDDKDIAATFRKKNKAERAEKEQAKLDLSPEVKQQLESILPNWRELSALPERTPKEIEEKKRRYLELTQHKAPWLLNQIASIPISQFFMSKTIANRPKLVTDSTFREYWSGQEHPQGQGIAAATALAADRHFFHWFLEFPDIIETGGFDCILGNPPFLGFSRISGRLGTNYLSYLKIEYAPAGAVDLVTYFFRRAFSLVRPGGFQAMIATNTVSQGSAREGGLDVILGEGGTINSAVRSMKWPGIAAVEVSLITIFRGKWLRKGTLDGKMVDNISAYLEDAEAALPPRCLIANMKKSFQGSYVHGDGFLVEPTVAADLIRKNPKNREALFPYLNGEDLNSDPRQQATRWAINFFNWDKSKCESNFPECFHILERFAKPEREKQSDERLRKYWWIHHRPRNEMYSIINPLKRVLVVARTSKTVAFVFTNPKQVLNANLTVIALDRFEDFAILQSTIHSSWAWTYCTTLKTDLIYTPTTVFETFPFPPAINSALENNLRSVGERYYDLRSRIMIELSIGLTKTYNFFNETHLTPELLSKETRQSIGTAKQAITDLLELRSLQVELDSATVSAYGWSEDGKDGMAIKLSHDFHEVDYLPENDRVRYTISPAARKEVLRRLLALNHERAAAEGAAIPAKQKRGIKAVKVDDNQRELL